MYHIITKSGRRTDMSNQKAFGMTVNIGKLERKEQSCIRDQRKNDSEEWKTLPFDLTIYGLDQEKASEVFIRWTSEAVNLGAGDLADSNFDITYDPTTKIMAVKVGYPRDFDSDKNMKAQKNALCSIFRKSAKMVSLGEK